MGQHTPGPWTAEEAGPVEAVTWKVRTAGVRPPMLIATGRSATRGDDGRPTEAELTAEANARLIAAAPELLEACRTAYVRLQCIHAEGTDEIHADAAYKALGEAIAKATGGQA